MHLNKRRVNLFSWFFTEMNGHQADDETCQVGEHVGGVGHDGKAARQVAADYFAEFNLNKKKFISGFGSS